MRISVKMCEVAYLAPLFCWGKNQKVLPLAFLNVSKELCKC
jgi:hypothetical protein